MDGYNVEYDDGAIKRIEAGSAGAAITKALLEYRGHWVKRCFRGGLAQDIHAYGIEEFDVPRHAPIDPTHTSETVHLKIPSRQDAFEFVKGMDVGGIREVRS